MNQMGNNKKECSFCEGKGPYEGFCSFCIDPSANSQYREQIGIADEKTTSVRCEILPEQSNQKEVSVEDNLIYFNEKLEESKKHSLELRNKIEQLELEHELPKLKEKYEGKFWKTENNYGGDDKKWWVYSHCKSIESMTAGIFDHFETCPYDEYRFSVNISHYFSMNDIEITKEEYQIAYNVFVSKLQSIELPSEL